MAGRLSKAEWNKLKQATAPFKGELRKGVKWLPEMGRKRPKWLKVPGAKEGGAGDDV